MKLLTRSLFFASAIFAFCFISVGVGSANYGYGYDDSYKDANTYSNTAKKSTIYCDVSTASELRNKPVIYLAADFGYVWKTDRELLAAKAGIDPSSYRGTKAQNMKIKEYLKAKIVVKGQTYEKKEYDVSKINYSLPVLKTTKTKASKLKYHTVVAEIAKEFGLDWEKDREKIAYVLGIENYNATRAQNMKIREALINNIVIE